MLNENFTSDDLPNDTLRAIYHYWLAMKGTALMPAFADFHPEEIPALLPHINFLEVEAKPRRYLSRQVGGETIKAMGIDFTGKYLDDFPLVELMLKKNYDLLVDNRRPYLNFDKLRWSSKSFLDYYALGLPMSTNGRDVDMVMLGLYYQFPKEMQIKFYNLEK